MISLPPYHNDGPRSEVEWKGLTLDEIRMRRAIVQARMEIQKYKMSGIVESVRERSPLFGGESSLFSRLTGAISFAEYAFVAIKLFKLFRSIFSKRKK